MSRDSHDPSPLFQFQDDAEEDDGAGESPQTIELLRHLIIVQERNNELLERLVEQVSASRRERAQQIGQWKEANPYLSKSCRAAAESLARVQAGFLEQLTEEVSENAEALEDSEFVLGEFVDRFGPRLAHLNGVIQVLSQLSNAPGETKHLPR